jgi:hypothetical protein
VITWIAIVTTLIAPRDRVRERSCPGIAAQHRASNGRVAREAARTPTRRSCPCPEVGRLCRS